MLPPTTAAERAVFYQEQTDKLLSSLTGILMMFPPKNLAERAVFYQEQMDELLSSLNGILLQPDMPEDYLEKITLALYKWRNYRWERDKALAPSQDVPFATHTLYKSKPHTHVDTIAHLLMP